VRVVRTIGPPYKKTVALTSGVSATKQGFVIEILFVTTIVGLRVGNLVGDKDGMNEGRVLG
jgi:hypothetical protein